MIDFSRRLFFRALRVAGWNHLCGNVMKRIAATAPTWPQILEQLSLLCSFFRNETWRTHIVSVLSSRIPGLAKLLKSFTAGVAKWRFEAIVCCLKQLLPLRRLCEGFIREELFANAQDRVSLQGVCNACRDKFLWRFIACALKHVFDEVEGMRHWGMVCPCCSKLREEGAKHLHCPRHSRRLREVEEFVTKRVTAFRQLAREITPAMCENDQALLTAIKAMLRCGADLFQRRCRYFSVVPWLFCQADTVDGAAACVEQVLARPLNEHDPTTQWIWGRLQADPESRAAGGDLTEALAEEVRILNHTPLDESCGEGYHRDTTREKCVRHHPAWCT